MGRLRVLPVAGAAAAGVLAALAIAQNFAVLSEARAPDVRAVSERSAAARGTCPWHPAKAQVDAHLGGYWRRDDLARCASAPQNYAELLAFGLHGARWALRNQTVDPALRPALFFISRTRCTVCGGSRT